MKILSYLQRKQKQLMQTIIVDDHMLLLESIVSIVDKTEGFNVCGTSSRVKEALDLLENNKVDLLITDYHLPDSTGLTLLKKARELHPNIKIIVLSMHDEPHLVKEVLKEKVDAYILKKDSQSELLNALNAVRHDKMYLSSDINTMLVNALGQKEAPQLLTVREREVLKLIIDENSNKDISKNLFISEYTVETHRKNIFRKTKCTSIVGLVKFAYANNLVDNY